MGKGPELKSQKGFLVNCSCSNIHGSQAEVLGTEGIMVNYHINSLERSYRGQIWCRSGHYNTQTMSFVQSFCIQTLRKLSCLFIYFFVCLLLLLLQLCFNYIECTFSRSGISLSSYFSWVHCHYIMLNGTPSIRHHEVLIFQTVSVLVFKFER